MKNCNQCGKCCIKYSDGGLSASSSEIEYWATYRPAIFDYVSNGDIWMNPETGEQLTICPWLRSNSDQNLYTCAIYFDRPEDCQYYPISIEQMIKDGCEMLSRYDIEHPQQAQKALDKLMIDSRPAFEK